MCPLRHHGRRPAAHRRGQVGAAPRCEEQSLQVIDSDSKQVVVRSRFGDGKSRAIDRQDRSAYLAVDAGSEMPAYEVYRSTKHPPFDWRHATFQKLRRALPEDPAADKEATDAALIGDVLRTLHNGTPVNPGSRCYR